MDLVENEWNEEKEFIEESPDQAANYCSEGVDHLMSTIKSLHGKMAGDYFHK